MIDLYVQEFHGRIPPDMYLVMGEDPHGTIDSSRFGLIERAQILGKVVERMTPPSGAIWTRRVTVKIAC